MRKVIRAIFVIVVAAFVGLGVQAVIAHAATAPVCMAHPSGHNCPAVLTNQGPWTPALHPRSLYMGNGNAPYITKITWTVYQHDKATAHGILHAAKAGCSGTSCQHYTVKITMHLSRTRWHTVNRHLHSGGYYFSSMSWKYTSSTKLSAPAKWSVNKRGYWQ